MPGVITLIKADHATLESLFKKLEKAEPGTIPGLLQQVAELLIPHSKAEEQVVYPAIKTTVPDEGSDVDDGLAEHQHVEQTLQELLEADPEAPGVDGLIAAMIGEADPQSDLHDAEVEKLLRLAACIWKLKHGMAVASPAKSPPAGE
jgi:hypothetical protein